MLPHHENIYVIVLFINYITLVLRLFSSWHCLIDIETDRNKMSFIFGNIEEFAYLCAEKLQRL